MKRERKVSKIGQTDEGGWNGSHYVLNQPNLYIFYCIECSGEGHWHKHVTSDKSYFAF